MTLITKTALALALTLSAPALARDVEVQSPIGADMEIDPLAYALGGASLHAGVHVDKTRFDLGVFMLPVPQWMHGNQGMSRDGVGFGLKADRFFGANNTGLHAGVQLDIATFDYVDLDESLSVSQTEVMTGARVGYRFEHSSGLYINPWLGAFTAVVNGGDVAVGDKSFANKGLEIFPTLHVGWRIR